LPYFVRGLGHFKDEVSDINEFAWNYIQCSQILSDVLSRTLINLMTLMNEQKPIELHESGSGRGVNSAHDSLAPFCLPLKNLNSL